MKLLKLIIIVFVVSFTAKSQNTVLFLNGDKMEIKNFVVDTSNFLIKYNNKNNKEKFIDISNVFSITDSLGNENVFYVPVKISDDSDTFSVEQMRSFVKGQFDADNEHKGKIAFGTGVVSGVGGVILFPGAMVFWSPVLPLGNAVLAGFTQPKTSKVIKLHPEMENNEHYILGYKEAARSKRTTAAIKGGAIGILLGILANTIYINVK